LVAEALAPDARTREAIRIGMPSGILAVGAAVEQTGPNGWISQRGSFFRTTRRLFAGRLYLQLS
jgi:2-methylaconitate cis-trans-isomerase PrpF